MSESSNRGCALMAIGLIGLLLAALLWLGASLNKTGTGLLEPMIGIAAGIVLVVGFVRRIRWIRGAN